MDSYWFCGANPPIQCHPQKKLRAIVLWQLLLAWKSLLLQNVFFSVPKRKCICWLCTPFFGMNTNSQKNPKISHDMTVDLPGIYFLSAPKETMIELVQVFLSQVDRRPCWAKLIKMSGMLSLEADKQCPAGTRTWPAIRYFFRYPTQPHSVLKIIG